MRLGHLLKFGGLFLTLVISAPRAEARGEWFRELDLEQPIAQASLVMAARVVEVSETKITVGGKAEHSIEQYRFEPLQVLKGVFSRDALALTSDDLGTYRFADPGSIERGQVRLLVLKRWSQGYAMLDQYSSFNHAVPLLRDGKDPLLETIKVILAMNGSRDREKKITLLVDGLQAQAGPAAIPLLAALARRSLLAAQTPGALEAVTKHLSDPSPAVREQAARTIERLLDADYLNQPKLREGAVEALAASLDRSDKDAAPRAAALEALGAAGIAALNSRSSALLLQLDQPSTTFVEQSSRLRAIGRLVFSTQRGALLTLLSQMPLDAPVELQAAAEWALARIEGSDASKQISARINNKVAAGLSVHPELRVLGPELRVFGELPATLAVPLLLDASKLSLDRMERAAFALACGSTPDPRLVSALSGMLDPHQHEVRGNAVEALRKIDTDEAARAVQPVLGQEIDLLWKLEIAEFLGRHGIRDGYPYAIEHMAEPRLREQAVAALAAIREPRARAELSKILQTSNDLAWESAAVRALGRLAGVELVAQFLEWAGEFKNPLAPSALIALGDHEELKALPIVRRGLASRSSELLTASARTAGKLLALPELKADDVRDQLASLLADPDGPQEARASALKSLVALRDSRLDGAMASAVRDAGLEGTELLDQIEKLLRDRKVKLTLR